jgi:hypothetical protein
MLIGRKFHERVKQIISDPAFEKPISNLQKDFLKKGTVILVTRIKQKN